MTVDIVILSYNRPVELERLLMSLADISAPGVSVYVNDDNSPRLKEISSVVEKCKLYLSVEVTLLTRQENVGYDRNLMSSFLAGSSDYLFLMSDDDYFSKSSCHLLFEEIGKGEFDVGMVAYDDRGDLCRGGKNLPAGKLSADLIYESILFSGLIFNRKSMPDFSSHLDFLGSCIYSQVFLVASAIANGRRLKNFNVSPILLGNDGENYFGLSGSASSEQSDLINRNTLVSNLRYQKRLITVVRFIDENLWPGGFNCFFGEYYRRLCGYLLKTPFGHRAELVMQINKLNLPFTFFQRSLLGLLKIIPYGFSSRIYKIGRSFLRKSG